MCEDSVTMTRREVARYHVIERSGRKEIPQVTAGEETTEVYPSADSSLEAWPCCSGPKVKTGQIHIAKKRTYSCCVDKLMRPIDIDPGSGIFFLGRVLSIRN